jgi:MATE family multidrug resistance protein
MVPQVALLLVGIGLLFGTGVLVAQADGAGRPEDCGRIWRLALLNAAALGMLVGLLMLAGETILRALGQDQAIAAGGGLVLAMLAPGMPAIFLFSATSAFLEGIGRPVAGMVVMLLANLVNLGLNALVMFGPFEQGAAGAALATSLARWFMVLALAGYALRMAGGRHYGIRAPLAGHWQLWRKLLRLGWPMALTFWLEHAAFFAAATFAGWLGTVPLAAYQIVLNVVGLIYMLAIGLATATGVRVGNAVGRGDRAGMARAGWTGLAIGIAIMLALTPVLHGASQPLAALYSAEPAVAELAALGRAFGAWILVADASQGVLTGALRGLGDVWAVAAIQLACFWALAIPACYGFALLADGGVAGLLVGLLLGLAAAALLLAWRFAAVTGRPVRPLKRRRALVKGVNGEACPGGSGPALGNAAGAGGAGRGALWPAPAA